MTDKVTELRALKKPMYPTFNSIEEAKASALKELVNEPTNTVVGTLFSYHNTLIEEIIKILKPEKNQNDNEH